MNGQLAADVERANDARTRLVESAIELFHDRSYTAVSVQQLCEHADVKKGSFYHFFPTKRELALAAVSELQQRVKVSIWEPLFSEDITPQERLERVFDEACEYFSPPQSGVMRGCPFGSLAAELSTQDEAMREAIEGVFDMFTGYFRRAIQEALDTGDVSGIDSEHTAEEMLAYFQGALLVAKVKNDPDFVRRAAPGVTRFLQKQ